MPKGIQRKRTKGWRMPENCVYVGRPSKWENPFTVAGIGRDMAVRLYERHVLPDLPVHELRGKDCPAGVRLISRAIGTFY